MKLRTLSNFEDSHPYVSSVPEGSKVGDQYASDFGVVTVKQKLGNTSALLAHVARFPAGAVLTEDNCPDIEARANDGTDRYPGWIAMGLVEVAE